MKKLLLASAVAALSVSVAQAAPTLYGKAFLLLDATDTDVTSAARASAGQSEKNKSDVNGTQLNSYTSRVGFKGAEALTANTDVVYKLEYGINIDDNTDQFYSRDTYLGLANAELGTLVAGRLTTIDDNVDFANVLVGKNVAKVGPTFDEPRADNAFAYISPNYDGMQWYAMYGMDSDQDAGGLDNEDQFGVAAKYAMDQMNIGASYITHGDMNHARISGDFAVSPAITVGALYQMSDLDTDDDENTFQIGATMATPTPWSYYAQVSMVDNVAGGDGDEAMGVGIGGKYKFTKAATGHLYAGYKDLESDNGIANSDGTNFTYEDSGFGIGGGLEYVF